MIPLVVQVEDQEGGGKEQFAFLKSPVRVGRGELNDLPLARPFVSTYHGIIQFDDAEARYLDLGSTNGSVLDGTPLERNQPARLGPTAELVIGTFRLTFARRVTSERPAVRQNATMFAARVARAVATSAGAPAAPVAAPPPPEVAAPPPPPAAEPVDAAGREAARRALDEAGLDLDLHYASYRGTWEHLRSAIEGVLGGLEPGARRAALEELSARYAQLRAEPQFAELLGPGAAPPTVPPPGPAPAAAPAAPGPAPAAPRGGVSPLLRAFAESYLPAAQAMESEADVELVLGRVSAALESFGRAFLELRRGHEEFGREMGVRPALGEGALQRVRDARQLLAYVLDPRASGRERELERAFADFMLHQVALLRGVVDGAQAMLARLSPETLAEEVPGSLWPMRAAALWKAYEARFHELADEEDAVSEVLFGREFAKAYASMAGRPADEGDERGSRPGGRGR